MTHGVKGAGAHRRLSCLCFGLNLNSVFQAGARMTGMFKDVTHTVNPEQNGGLHLVI